MGGTTFLFYESGQEEIGPGLLTTQLWDLRFPATVKSRRRQISRSVSVWWSQVAWRGRSMSTTQLTNHIWWKLNRYKQAARSQEKLLKFYILKVKSILIFGAVHFHFSLNLDQRHILQQKQSLVIILGSDYRSYSQARSQTNLPELNQLREEACVKWAMKAQASKNIHRCCLSIQAR